jgi:hypothetical protein
MQEVVISVVHGSVAEPRTDQERLRRSGKSSDVSSSDETLEAKETKRNRERGAGEMERRKEEEGRRERGRN